jgi:hypothetical protein
MFRAVASRLVCGGARATFDQLLMRTGDGGKRAEAERLEQLAEELYEAERLQRRQGGLRERLEGCVRQSDELALELEDARREVRRVRRGLLGLWLWLRGTRVDRLEQAEGIVARLQRRQQNTEELTAVLETELAESRAGGAGGRPVAELRLALDAGLDRQRTKLESEAPEIAARVAALEVDLPRARAERAAADRALADLGEIEGLLEEADGQLSGSLGNGLFEALVVDTFLSTRAKYARIDAAAWRLRDAMGLLRDIPALASVREELEPLAPSIDRPTRILDYMTSSMLVNMRVAQRTEASRDAIVEAQKLCRVLRPMLERAAMTSRNQAQNLEQRWRVLLLDFATDPETPSAG